jgi:hypothetical protein
MISKQNQPALASILPALFLLLSNLAVSASFLSVSLSASAAAKNTVVGTLVDITCATDPKKDLGRLRTEHTRRCLLMPLCADSGYALLDDANQLLRFDAKGNELARKLIEKHDHVKSWRIKVEGITNNNGQVSVEHLKLL